MKWTAIARGLYTRLMPLFNGLMPLLSGPIWIMRPTSFSVSTKIRSFHTTGS
jgi:hypothetical protein